MTFRLRQTNLAIAGSLAATAVTLLSPTCASAQSIGAPMPGAPILPSPNLSPAMTIQNIAQAQPPTTTGLQQIDLTPVRLPERDDAFSTMETTKIDVMNRLPAKMFINMNVENSLRLETNAFQTAGNQRPDMVYRVLPDITIGYAFNEKTRVSAQYFMFRDQYTEHSRLLSRNVQSVGIRADRDFQITPRTMVTSSIIGRQLFITHTRALSDIIPSVAITHRKGQHTVLYGSVLGQIRFKDIVGDRFQEGDQFYSIGAIYRKPMYMLTGDFTLIDNFGNGNLRSGPDSNHIMVLTMEAARRVHKTIPVMAFIRAQPIFNIGQNSRAGFAGVNFRLFGGLRLEVSKPPLFPMKLRGL